MIRTTTICLFACAVLAGCASPAARKPDARDPFERVNRATFAFNETVDRAIAKPAARAYKRVVPGLARRGITNVFSNLEQPGVMVNDLLQGKLRPAAHDAGRFLLNTTLGLGGLFDPASPAGLDRNEEDFGQTFGKWGIPVGSYLMLPLLGPSSVRDGLGGLADEYADPSTYIEEDKVRWGAEALKQLDRRARLLEVEGALERAYDRYALIRSAYLQRREYLVSDGEVPEEELEDPALEDPEPADGPPPTALRLPAG